MARKLKTIKRGVLTTVKKKISSDDIKTPIVSASFTLEFQKENTQLQKKERPQFNRKLSVNFMDKTPIGRYETELDRYLDEDFVAPQPYGKEDYFVPYAYNPRSERYRPSYICRKLREYIEDNEFPILAELMSKEGWNCKTFYQLANRSPYIAHLVELLTQKKQIYFERSLLDPEKIPLSKNIIAIWDRMIRGSEASFARAISSEMASRQDNDEITFDTTGRPIIDVKMDMKDKSTRIIPLVNSINSFYSKSQKVNPLYTKKTYILLEGGRGGGKSFSASDIVIYKALTRTQPGIILCGREIQGSIKNSSKYLLELRIAQYGLNDLFDITDNEIRVRETQVKIIFLGMREGTKEDTVKSLAEVFFFWGEEAQNFSQATIDKLIPTVIRNKDAQLIFTMNRTFENDAVYLEFTTVRPDETLHIKINYYDNPFVPESILSEAEMMKISNYAKWLHLYEGEPQTVFDDSLWSLDLIQSMRSPIAFDRGNYIEVVVSCDPATTNKNYSNEYGIQVLGITKYGEVHQIKDYSGKYSVNEFANVAITAYYDFNADGLVVEVNNGGDFIKNTFLTIDQSLHVIEVRAKHDKTSRAKPIVNLAQLGKIKHIGNGSPTLETQMLRMTEQGFQGEDRGESPDRVDAYVWGCIHLFRLSNLDTIEVYIKAEYFPESDDYSNERILTQNVGYAVLEGEDAGIILFDFVLSDDDKTIAVVKNYWKMKTIEFTSFVQDLLNQQTFSSLFIQDDKFGNPILNELKRFYVEPKALFVSKFHKKKLDEKVIIALPYLQRKQIQIKKLPNKQYNASLGNLFINELTKYSPNVPIDRPLLSCILNLLFKEWNISEE